MGIKTLIIIFVIIFTVACVTLKKNTILYPLSDNDYIKHYRPLLITTITMYRDNMTKEDIESLTRCIYEMDKQAIYSKKIEIYESILLILDPIVEDFDKNTIYKEEAHSALNSLEFLIKKYENSPLLKEIYPKLKKALQLFA